MDTKVKQYNKQLDAIYKPQAQQLRQEYQALLPQLSAQEESLRQAKVNAFRDIKNEAVTRGAGWSGFLPHEEAQYVGEKYLPALAQVTQQRQQGQRDLRSALLGLQTDRRSRVMDFRETLRQEAQERKRLQEEREFERQMQREQLAASAANARIGAGPETDPAQEMRSSMNQQLLKATGSDGKVSPAAWARALNAWRGEGGDDQTFFSNFGDYVNQSHAQDYFGFGAPFRRR